MSLTNSKKIKNFFPHSVTGKNDDSFVGLKIIGNEIHFFYPETYHFDLDSETVRADIIDILRTISIAKTSIKELTNVNTKSINSNSFALVSYLWVIKDFLSNGFYVNREKQYKLNQPGRIDWKRTMQQQPIVSEGNIIYPNFVVSVKSNVDNILVEIHKYCVKKSIDFIGWLFNLNSSFIQMKPFNAVVKRQYISTLKKELDKTFDDDKRVRLNHFLKVIIGLDNVTENKEFIYGVDNYYYVFERMIDSIFGNINEIKNFNPKANWYLKQNSYKETPSSDLRPDTLIIDKEKNTVFILDSKFYRFGYTGDERDLPETTSIQKQITYGDYIKKNVSRFQIEHVYNAFLLPYDKKREVFCSNENIQYIGYAKSEWKDNNAPHEFVHTFLIDLRHVIKTWNKINHTGDVQFLIDEIKKHNEEIRKKNNLFFFYFDEDNKNAKDGRFD